MKRFNPKYELLSSLVFFMFLALAPYQKASAVDPATGVTTLNGTVIVKLEPHGSIRAKVYQGEVLQYEFILDRQAQQKMLTQNIDSANVYLVGNHREELVIDDLKTQKRFVLSMFDKESKLENVPPARTQPITIKGYSISLVGYFLCI